MCWLICKIVCIQPFTLKMLQSINILFLLFHLSIFPSFHFPLFPIFSPFHFSKTPSFLAYFHNFLLFHFSIIPIFPVLSTIPCFSLPCTFQQLNNISHFENGLIFKYMQIWLKRTILKTFWLWHIS